MTRYNGDMSQERFITFEGGEGAGKSTQVRLLANRLEALEHGVVVTREPGGSPFAETLRQLLLAPDTPPHDALTEALIFYAARADHLNKAIRPALLAGNWVLCDRFSDSTRVYQCIASTLPSVVCDRLDEIVVGETQPGLTVIMDIDPEEGLARAYSRRLEGVAPVDGEPEADRYESRDLSYHRRLRDGFLEIANANPSRCIVVDAADHIEVIAEKIWSELAKRLLREAL